MKNATKLFTEIQITAKGNNKFRQEHLMQTRNSEKEEDIFCLRNNVLDLKEFGNMNKRN